MRTFKKHKNFLILLFLLLCASFLRLYRIADYMTFLGDEGRDVLVVYNILHGKFTLLGPTSSVGGFFLGPIYYYFMAPFLLLFNYNPVGPAVMVALFGVLTVFLVYAVGAEFFGKTAGFVAASLYTISPLVIAYSRSSWNPNAVPLFTLLTLYCLYKALRKKSIALFFLTGLLYGICMQLHYVEVFVGLIIILYVSVCHFFARELFRVIKDGIYILIGFLAGLSPFFAFELRHGFPDLRSIYNFIFHSSDTGSNAHFFATVWDVLFRLFGRLITKFPPPEQISVSDSKVLIDLFVTSFTIPVYVLYVFTALILIPSVVYLLFLLRRSIQQKKESFYKYCLLSIWLIVGVFLFGFYKKAIYDYYFGFMFPLPFLLVGNVFSFFYEKGHIFRKVSIAIFIVLIVLNLSGIPFRYPANKQLEQVKQIARFVYDKTEGKPYNFALITGGNSDHAYRYFFTLWGKPPVVIEGLASDPQRTSVTDQLLVVCEAPTCAPLGHSLQEIAGFGRAEIAGKWDVSVVKVFKLIHYKGK